MQLRIFTEPQLGATYDDQLAVARAAEEGGFDAFFRSDHYLHFGGDPGPGPTDSWVTLGALARETANIRLGTLVTSATFRLPGPLAIQVAQVDQMSGGRVEFGLGTGWYEAEHKAYGIPFGTFPERFERLTEQLEILTGMWGTPKGETFSYEGRHYTLVDSPALPKPAQRPRPPVILGGAGPTKTPALAARFADEFNMPFRTLEQTIEQFGRVRQACEAAGRDPATLRLSAALTVFCGRDETEVQRRVDAVGHTLQPRDVAGTPEQVAERLRQFGEAGASRIYTQVLDIGDVDHVRLIGAEVAPLVG